jgi:hypothetical protein
VPVTVDLVEGLQPEGVQDDLDARDMRPGDRGQRLAGLLDAHAVRGDRAVRDQGVERVVHPVVLVDGGRRAVQLHEVERVLSEVRPRPVRPLPEVLERVRLGGLWQAAAHLGGDGERHGRVRRQEGADDALAAPVAVDVRRVEQRDAGLGARLEHGPGVGLGDVAPVAAQLPGAEADGGDGTAGAAEDAGGQGVAHPSTVRGGG